MKYYCIKQHDITDCGAACLAAVSKQYGLKMPINDRLNFFSISDTAG